MQSGTTACINFTSLLNCSRSNNQVPLAKSRQELLYIAMGVMKGIFGTKS